jgi:hypothetical protein
MIGAVDSSMDGREESETPVFSVQAAIFFQSYVFLSFLRAAGNRMLLRISR